MTQQMTYDKRYMAHLGAKGNRVCIIPDAVAIDQKAWDGKTFVVIVPAGWRGTGTNERRYMRVKLVGDDYGLHTTGRGDVVVRPMRWLSSRGR